MSFAEMTAEDPSLIPVAVMMVRALRQWNQKQLAAAMGVTASRVSQIETEAAVPKEPELRRLCRAAGITYALFKRMVELAATLRAALGDDRAQEDLVQTLDLAAGLAAKVGAAAQVVVLSALVSAGAGREAREAPAETPERLTTLWQRLQSFPPRGRRFLIKEGKEYQTVDFCKRLCDESEKLAADDADAALEWAELAREVAQRAPAEAAERRLLEGLTLGFIGNAWRIKGKLRAGDEAFAQARALWAEGVDPAGRLPAWRLDDLEASLRVEQGRFEEAFSLFERALAAAPAAAIGALLLKKADAQRAAEDFAGRDQKSGMERSLPNLALSRH